MLVELSVVEQRYHAVMEVVAGVPVTEVAARYGVSRQSVHTWVSRYRDGGLVLRDARFGDDGDTSNGHDLHN